MWDIPDFARLLRQLSSFARLIQFDRRGTGLSDPVPIDEDSPVRTERYPYRGKLPDRDDYDKLDVEETYLPRGALVMRLPMVYGEHDYQRREEYILRRVRAGRKRIPFGAGNWLPCRGYVRDIANGIRLALESDVARGLPLNLCEDRTHSVHLWSHMILAAARATVRAIRVTLPPVLMTVVTPCAAPRSESRTSAATKVARATSESAIRSSMRFM